MPDDDKKTSIIAAALAPAAEAVAAEPLTREQVIEGILRTWVTDNMSNSAFSQNVEAWNALQRSIPDLVKALAA